MLPFDFSRPENGKGGGGGGGGGRIMWVLTVLKEVEKIITKSFRFCILAFSLN